MDKLIVLIIIFSMVYHNFLDSEIIKRKIVMTSDFLGFIDRASHFLFLHELIPNIKFSTFAESAVFLAVALPTSVLNALAAC